MFQKEESQRMEPKPKKNHELGNYFWEAELAPIKEDTPLPDIGSDMISWISELLWTREPYVPPVPTFPIQSFHCSDLVPVLPLYVDVWKADFMSS